MKVSQGLTREEKIAKARELRTAGLSYVEIGNRLGVTGSCVGKWCNPDRTKEWNRRSNAGRNAYKRRIAQTAGAANCVRCGSKLSEGSAWRGYSRCRACFALAETERIDQRRRMLEKWWADGLTLRQIAQHLGWTVGHVECEIHCAREAGYALPYRRPRSKPAFPEQVPA